MTRRFVEVALALVALGASWVLASSAPVARSTDSAVVVAAAPAGKAAVTASVAAGGKKSLAPAASPFEGNPASVAGLVTSDSKSGGASIVTSSTLAVPGTYATLQAAISAAADGDTITVAAGTYTEVGQIAITKNLTIRGANAATTIIKPDADYGAGWWTVAAGKSLVLRGVTLDGAGKALAYGIVNDGTGAIRECVLKNISQAVYLGIAIESRGNMDVTGCTFQNIERVGVRTTDSTCTIAGNVFEGRGSAVANLNYFLEIRRGCNIGVYNNRISDCSGAASDGSGSCAIQAYSDWPTAAQTTVVVRGNTLRNCTMGVVLGTYASDDNTIGTVNYNDWAGIQPALETGSTVQADGQYNWWGDAAGPLAEQIVTSGTSWGVNWTGSADTDPWLLNGQVEMAAGGARLAATQNADGAWGWPLTGGSATNTIAPIAMGLAQAHRLAPTATTLAALQKASAFLLAKTNNFAVTDGYLAAELDALLGVTTHVAHVNANFYAPLAAGTYNRKGLGTLYDTASYVNLVRSSRAGSQANMAAWDVGMGLAAAYACGADTTAWIAGTQAEVNELSLGNYNVIGLAGALYGLKVAGAEFDPTSGLFASASSLNDLAVALAACQLSTGGFAWETDYVIDYDDNETIQETAYSVLALSQFSGYRTQIVKAVRYLASMQLSTGGWENYRGYGENNEITGEALWAAAAANRLSLDAPAASLYVKRNDSVFFDMNVANLLQEVKACQAILGYSSAYFQAGANAIAAGGSVWDDLIYSSWTTAGKLDTAVGVYGESTAGTQADGTVAKITLTVKPDAADGATQMVFRTDVDCDSSRVECTYLSDMNAFPVFPSKRNSVNVIVDSTPPNAFTISGASCVKSSVTLTFAATDPEVNGVASGIDSYELFLDSTSQGVVTSPCVVNLASVAEGAHAVLVRAFDKAGNATDATFTVNKDNAPPTITCPGPVTKATDAGSCQATNVDIGTATGSDECSTVTITNDHASTTYAKGTTTVTWTATDAAGNTATCTQTVTVNDAEKPTITCPADKTVPADNGACYATNVALGTPVFSDNCPDASVANNAPTQFPVGTTTVVWTVTDTSGNTETCSQRVIVEDKQAPTITAYGDNATASADGTCQAAVPDMTVGVVATDNCTAAGSLVITQSPAVGTVYAKSASPITVTVTVVDAAGNAATCDKTFTIVDTTKPVITLVGGATVNLQCPTAPAWVDPGYSAADNCDGTVTVTVGGDTVKPGSPGTYVITYDAVDAAGNQADRVMRTVIVEQPNPTISNVPADLVVECQGAAGVPASDSVIAAWLATPTVVDGCDSDAILTNNAPSVFPLGPTTVTWTATDPDTGSYKAEISRTVTVRDTTAPVFTTCPASPADISVGASCTAAIPNLASQAAASDGCGNVTITQDPIAGTEVGPGSYNVTLTATDSNGNSNSGCVVVVKVVDTTLPVIAGCPTDITQPADMGSCGAVVTWTAPTVTDNCSATLTSNKSPGDTFPKGTTTVTYTAKDAANNTVTCSFTVTIVDQQPPSISCPAAQTLVADANCQAKVPDLTSGVASDNCTSVTVTQSPAANTIVGLGTTHVTLTATDGAGLTASCTADLTVVDQTAPVLGSVSATPLCIGGAGDVTITASATDCNGTIVWSYSLDGTTWQNGLVVPASSLSEGANTITVKATDAAGNSSTTTVTVTKDSTAPAITAATAAPTCVKSGDVTITVEATDGGCASTITWKHKVGSGEWVAGLTVVASELAEGPNTLAVQATDGNGNASEFPVAETVSKDTTPPVISAVVVKQGGTTLVCPAEAVQGAVDIYVTATDAGCAGFDQTNLSVSVAGITPVTYVDKAGDVYHFQATVVAATANGSHAITVGAQDALGNAAASNTGASICVNKTQIAGTVSFDTASSAAYSCTRDVVFKATNSGGTVLKTWTVSLTFTNAASVATSGTYTLTGVPADTVKLSAKTAWSLRKKLAISYDADGQATGNFALRSGDLDGSNSVNILDYTKLKTKWNTLDAAADINGDRPVNTVDYSVMKANWFSVGDPQ